MSRLPLRFGLLVVFVLSGLLLSSLGTHGQTAGQFIAKGNKELQDGYHQTAIFYFKKALGIDTTILEANFKMAEAYRMLRNYKRAVDFYEATINMDGQDEYPEAHLYLGIMLKQLGRYEDAIRRLRIFQSIYKARDAQYRQARDELLSCEWANVHSNDTAVFEVTRPDSGINTRHAEMAPFYFGDSILYFSTMRYEKDEVRKTNPAYVEVKKVVKDSNGWKNEVLDLPFTFKDEHVGNLSFSLDGKHGFFSVCPAFGDCMIYQINKGSEGKWSVPFMLGAPVNEPGSSNSQPALISAGKNELLVFTSNRASGKGGLDLWFVEMKNGEPTARIRNLGANVNTEGDEITPYFDHADSLLYYSSNRLPGFGGFDIFKFQGLPGSRNLPENLGTDINSPADDYYFMGRKTDSLYYFASNRKGGIKKSGNETCCNDLYLAIPIIEEIVEDTIMEADSLLAEVGDSILTDTVAGLVIDDKKSVEIEQPKNIEELQTLLPIALYFHNDQPDPRTLATSTKLSYPETIESYIKLQSTYIDVLNASELLPDEKISVGDEMAEFFEQSLDRSLTQLDKALRVLLTELEDSNKINLAVKGYASTLASNDYNLNLTLRRISSMENYIKTYQNGAFLPFIASGALTIEKIPFGESKAASNISDDANDALGSIYSPAAARERRIEILKVERQQ